MSELGTVRMEGVSTYTDFGHCLKSMKHNEFGWYQDLRTPDGQPVVEQIDDSMVDVWTFILSAGWLAGDR